jgi:TonB-linked SusC/RagA family outer membrane protein
MRQNFTTLLKPVLSWLALCLCLILPGYAQQANTSTGIKGTVVNDRHEMLVGVSVTISEVATGIHNTSVTDEKGIFTFNGLKAGGVYNLTFTYIGFEQQTIKNYKVKANETNSLLVKLKETVTSLGDVVVVGYGSQKKINLTGAVTQVGGDDVMEDRPMPNMARGLEGVVPGLNISMTDGKPIRSPSFNIRGTTSISGAAPALVLIDGVSGDPSLLNPSDIETITVLKDAASAAIYGARAAYGVVLITTKSPRKGGVQVNFNTNYTVNQKTIDPKLVTDGYEWTKDFADSYNAWYDYKSPPTTINGIMPYSPSYLDSMKARQTDPSLPKVTIDPATGKYIYYGSTDWYHLLYRQNIPSQEDALSISGSNQNSDFLISGRYYTQGGIFRFHPDDFDRYNLRAKGDVTVAPWLTVSDNIDFNTYSYYYPVMNGMSPVWRYLDVTAIPNAVLFNPDGTLTPSSYQGVGDLYTGNNYTKTRQLYFRNTASFSADIIKNVLNLKGDFTYAYTNQQTDGHYYPVSYSAGPGLTGNNTNNFLNRANGLTKYLATNIYAQAQKDFGAHSVKLLAGMNVEDSRFDTSFFQRDGLLDPSLPDFNLLNGINYQVKGGGNEWSIAGFFFRANYAYKNRYLLEVNGRYDGSSKFPSNSRFGFFPSVSAGWIISNESFMEQTHSWLNNLKIRGSFGSLGNGVISPYRFIPSMNVSQSTGIIINGAFPTYTRSPNVLPNGLTWESSTTANVGVDVSVLKNRLNVTYDYYERFTTGMFTPSQPLPAVFGATVPYGNYSNLKTDGWELNASWKDRISKNFSYSVGFVLSDSKAFITKYNNPNGILPYPYAQNPSVYYKGERVGEMWGFVNDGLYTQDELNKAHPDQTSYIVVSNSNVPMPGDIRFKDLNGDNAINIGKGTLADHGDIKVIGNNQPRYNFGVNLGATYSMFSVSAFIQGVGHRDWWPGTEAGAFWGQYNRPYESVPAYMMKNVWSETNPNAYFPRYRGYVALQGNRELAVLQTRYMQNAAYARLKNFNITWNLPKHWAEMAKMQSARIYFTGQNLFTVSPMHKWAKNFDPEVIDGADPEVSQSAGNGYDYPMLKSYTVGLNLTF